MRENKLYIRNMVCDRCKKSVSEILRQLNIEAENILLGEVTLKESLPDGIKEELSNKLTQEGFELIDDKKSRIISRIKTLILEHVKNLNYNNMKFHLSDYLAGNLNADYTYLSNLFSSVEGQTIENYYILQKVERAKELLVYDELTLSEIAMKLGYSSTAHLSNQFKKVTGLTPTHFKSIGAQKRYPLDKL
jgi:AraC family transcriptional regulator